MKNNPYSDLMQLVTENYNITITSISLLVEHYPDSKVFVLESLTENYVLKEMDSCSYEDEGELADYLISKGIKIPKLYRACTGEHIVNHNERFYVLYEFVDGTMYDLHTAPDWFVMKSAQTLGQIQSALKGYKQLPVGFAPEFFNKEKYTNGKKSVMEKIKRAKEKNDIALVVALKERLKHIERVSCFEFDCDKLTYVNSHGDFYINQIIVRNDEFVTIDWSCGASCILACFEVLMSYTYAAPECKYGEVDVNNFKPYLLEYMKYTPLNHYDLKMMPYFMYHYCIFCSFTPPYDDLSDDYLKIAHHTDNLANWLHENVEMLSEELTKLGIEVKMNLILRLETHADHYAVENLTREAFTDWKKHREGGGICDEHLLVHKLRKDPVYVPELNFVAELDGQIVGHIIYSKAKIVGSDGVAHEVLTFGPISVLPKCQKRGIGGALIEHTTAEAKRLGFKAIVIHGHPEYYPRFGFKRAREFGLTPEHDPCMAMELIPDALYIPGGHFTEAPVFFNLPQAEVEEFDKQFINLNGKGCTE
ncbi:MAG: N-acetyltransferase [Oscillospiraceae bacterium]|nr:N-acetyltransferase [Oscillospiraceae bacterium]